MAAVCEPSMYRGEVASMMDKGEQLITVEKVNVPGHATSLDATMYQAMLQWGGFNHV